MDNKKFGNLIKELRKEKIKKIKKRIGITSIIVFIILLILQIVYLIILKRHNYEYVVDVMEYIINQIIILSATSSIVLLIKKKKVNAIIYIMAVISTIINIAFMCNNGLKNKSLLYIKNSCKFDFHFRTSITYRS